MDRAFDEVAPAVPLEPAAPAGAAAFPLCAGGAAGLAGLLLRLFFLVPLVEDRVVVFFLTAVFFVVAALPAAFPVFFLVFDLRAAVPRAVGFFGVFFFLAEVRRLGDDRPGALALRRVAGAGVFFDVLPLPDARDVVP